MTYVYQNWESSTILLVIHSRFNHYPRITSKYPLAPNYAADNRVSIRRQWRVRVEAGSRVWAGNRIINFVCRYRKRTNRCVGIHNRNGTVCTGLYLSALGL